MNHHDDGEQQQGTDLQRLQQANLSVPRPIRPAVLGASTTSITTISAGSRGASSSEAVAPHGSSKSPAAAANNTHHFFQNVPHNPQQQPHQQHAVVKPPPTSPQQSSHQQSVINPPTAMSHLAAPKRTLFQPASGSVSHTFTTTGRSSDPAPVPVGLHSSTIGGKRGLEEAGTSPPKMQPKLEFQPHVQLDAPPQPAGGVSSVPLPVVPTHNQRPPSSVSMPSPPVQDSHVVMLQSNVTPDIFGDESPMQAFHLMRKGKEGGGVPLAANSTQQKQHIPSIPAVTFPAPPQLTLNHQPSAPLPPSSATLPPPPPSNQQPLHGSSCITIPGTGGLKLDSYQEDCVHSDLERPLLIHAGAGSGKTRTIVCRIVSMLKQGIRPSNILGLTFTKKSAEEFRQRIHTMLLSDDELLGGAGGSGPSASDAAKEETAERMRKSLKLCTLHALCLRIVHEFGPPPGSGYKEDVGIQVMGDRKLKSQVYDELMMDQSFDWPEEWRMSREPKKEFLALVEKRRGDVDYNPLRKFYGGGLADDINRLYDEFQRVLRVDKNAMDFNDMQFWALKMIKEQEEVRTKLHSRYRYIVVDEFQDLTNAQFQMITTLLPEGSGRVTVVGDPNQCIYTWRGALENIFARFKHHFRDINGGVVEARLPTNYRSSTNIVQSANTVVNAAQSARFPDGPKAKTLIAKSEYTALLATVSEIDQLKQEYSVRCRLDGTGRPVQYEYRDMCILTRRRQDALSVSQALNAKNIPNHVLTRAAPDQGIWMKTLLANLKLVLDPHSDTAYEAATKNPHKSWAVRKFAAQQFTIGMNAARRTLAQKRANTAPNPVPCSAYEVMSYLVDNGFTTLDEFEKFPITNPCKELMSQWVHGIRRVRMSLTNESHAVKMLQLEIDNLFGMAKNATTTTTTTTSLSASSSTSSVSTEMTYSVVRCKKQLHALLMQAVQGVFGYINFENFTAEDLKRARKMRSENQQAASGGNESGRGSGKVGDVGMSNNQHMGDAVGDEDETPLTVVDLVDEIVTDVVAEEAENLRILANTDHAGSDHPEASTPPSAANANYQLSLPRLLQLVIDELTTITDTDDFGGASSKSTNNAIWVTTVHQAKGLEWPVVFLFGCVEGLFPLYGRGPNPAQMEREEKRVVYVAMSRPEEQLRIISWDQPKTMASGGGGGFAGGYPNDDDSSTGVIVEKGSKPSEFIANLPPDCHERVLVGAPPAERGGAQSGGGGYVVCSWAQ